jgi:lipopolysaccharide transport system permease protein
MNVHVPVEQASAPREELAGLSPWVEATPAGVGEIARAVAGFPALVWRHRDFVRTSVRRDLAARLSGTLLGRAWPLIAPLAMFAAYYFLFTRIFGVRVGALPPEQRGALGVYMFLGVVIWSAFADSLARSTHAFVDAGPTIKKIAFPAELVPLQIALANLVTMAAALFAFVLATWVSPVWRAPGAALALAPVLLIAQALFTTGLGLALATFHVFVRDTAHVVAVAITLWMFFTPVFWIPSAELLPEVEPWLGAVRANPMHQLLYAWRSVLMSGEPRIVFDGELAQALLRFALTSAVVFAAGYAVYVRGRRRILDEV